MARDSHSAFTLVEILVVIGILAILAALLFPVVQGVVSRGHNAKCISNLRQISAASASYSADNAGQWPPGAVGVVFAQVLIPYLGNVPGTSNANFLQSPLICQPARRNVPDDTWNFRGIYTPTLYDPARGKYGITYGQNTYASTNAIVRNRLTVQNPSKMMLYMDMLGNHQATIGRINMAEVRENLEKRHGGKVNVAYVDGSVGSVSYDDIPATGNPAANTPNAGSMFWTGRGMSQ